MHLLVHGHLQVLNNILVYDLAHVLALVLCYDVGPRANLNA